MKIISFLKAVWAVIITFFMALSPAGFPRVPHEKDFTLVWADEFDGDSVDPAKWEGHGFNGQETIIRRGSYWNTDFATVKDGNLRIRTEYCPDGCNGNGLPGWYTCGLDTAGIFEPTHGYFECRCILPKGEGMWSAFWLISRGMAFSNEPGEVIGGTDGAEVDVFESAFYESSFPRRVSSNIHVDGYGEYHRSANVCKPWLLVNDPYEDFNTYGLEWNEKEYIFYVNGAETGRSDFGGACLVPMYLILSVEVGGNNAVPAADWTGGPITDNGGITDFVIDYVRAYSYK